MTDNEVAKALDILEKHEFFVGQRAGRELWSKKPVDVQNKDIEDFAKDFAYLKDFINRQKAEIERLKEAIKEFAERLRKKITDYYGKQDQEEDEGSAVCDYLSYLGCDIDDLVKEMTEDAK